MALVCALGVAERSPEAGVCWRPPRGLPGKGTDPGGPTQPVDLVCARGGVDWTPQPACLLGGSGCPFAAPRMAWFLGQPPVLRVLPVPAQTLWVQSPGAALGPVCARVCMCASVCPSGSEPGRGWLLPLVSTVWWSSPAAPLVDVPAGPPGPASLGRTLAPGPPCPGPPSRPCPGVCSPRENTTGTHVSQRVPTWPAWCRVASQSRQDLPPFSVLPQGPPDLSGRGGSRGRWPASQSHFAAGTVWSA